MSTTKKMLLGAHMSIAGGFENALLDGYKTHCSAIQLFTKSNQQWAAKEITQDQIDRFALAKKATNIDSIVTHANYLINLCSDDATTLQRSRASLRTELERCELLGIKQLVVHPGSRKDQPLDEALKKIVESIDIAFDGFKGDTTLLLENMAGQGSIVCRSLEELAFITNHVHNTKKIGVCIDTCHAFAAGYNIGTSEGYDTFWKLFDQHIGLSKLGAMHVNNSAKECGSRVDRHDHIKEGKIPLELFNLLMNDERLIAVPKLLETPKSTDLHEDKLNLKVLMGLLEKKNQKYIIGTNLEAYL